MSAPRWPLWQRAIQFLCWAVAPAAFRLRVLGREHLPSRSAFLIVSNHQSFLDPVLLALAVRREVAFMARASLFRPAPFRLLIRALHAFPVRRGRADLAAAKAAVARLRAGQVVCLFPEGTRTRDGSLAPFHAGFGMIAERAGVPVVPAAVDGAHEAWPRSRLLPRPTTIWVAFGRPLAADDLHRARSRRVEFGADVREQVGVLRRHLNECRRRLKRP